MIKIPYGPDTVGIDLDADIVLPKKAESDEKEVLENCITALKEFLGEKVTYIVNDNKRPTKTKKILDSIELKPDDSILIATGAHDHPGGNWIRENFGESNVHVHDARRSSFTYYGKTSFGNDVYLNSLIDDTEKIVAINSVEPHYFAGFTGGRKSFLPGIAKFETIERNHKHALNENARTLNLKGNPVHEEMMEVCSFVGEKKEVFGINLVQDLEDRIADIKYGDIKKSFYDACDTARKLFATEIEKKYDTVISVAKHPMDINLYQSQKAMENAKPALKNGGNLILVSKCSEGIGPSEFYNLLKSGTPEEVMEKIREGYRLGWHKTAKMIEALRKYNLYAVTELPDNVLKAVGFIPWKLSDLEGIDGDVLVIPNGGITVPCFLLQ
ncbi:MAG: nickel-dependent lactate racemase [Euryarchaeota archaeon]|nr:nickel-dependent lactate racemase [Euryarchaeota archaeon]